MTSTPDLSRLDDIDGPDLEELGGFTDDTAPNPVDFVVFDIGNVLIRWEPLLALEPVVGRERAEAERHRDEEDQNLHGLTGGAARSAPRWCR